VTPTIQFTPRTAAPPAGVRVRSRLAVAAVAVGAPAIVFGLTHDAVRTWSNLLVDGFFVLSLALGGLVFTAIHHLSGAAWSAGMRRIAEAMMAALPMAGLMMLALFFGRSSLFAWASIAPSHDVGTPGASVYFAVPLVCARAIAFLSLWMMFAALIRRTSAFQDSSSDPIHHEHSVRYSAMFIVVFAVSFSLASVDWILSLDPKWTSTMFAVYVFSGLLVEAVAALTLAVVILHQNGRLEGVVTTNHLHDLGKMLLAFTTFWAYIWFSQYLLIWYANLPEEIGYYELRTNPAWLAWFLIDLGVNWVVPFVVLLPRSTKRDPATLKWIAIVILLGRWLDVYLLVAPQTMKAPAFGVIELSLAFAYAGLTWHVVSGALAHRPLVIRYDPRLDECVRIGQQPC